MNYALGNLFPHTFESFGPAATPAAEIRVIPWRTLYVKAAVLSGNRDPYNQDTTGFNFQIKDSPVFVDEIGYRINPTEEPGDKPRKTYPGHYKFGSAYNAGKFPNAQGVEHSGNYLVYAGANQAVYRTTAGSAQGLDLLAAWDWSPQDTNRQNTQTTLGARYNGPFSARPQDSVAFAFIYSRIADLTAPSASLPAFRFSAPKRPSNSTTPFISVRTCFFSPFFSITMRSAAILTSPTPPFLVSVSKSISEQRGPSHEISPDCCAGRCWKIF